LVFIGKHKKVSMKVLILAGGLGKRIASITNNKPKCMLEVHKKPFLEYLVRHLVIEGLSNQIFLIGHKANDIIEYFGDGRRFSANILYSVDEQLTGTAGALKNCEHFLGDEVFFVINGDTYTKIKFARMYRQHKDQNAQATICISKRDLSKGKELNNYAGININKDKEVLSYSEKSSGDYIGCGTYLFDGTIFQYLQKGINSSLEYNLIPTLLENHHRISSYLYKGPLFDIGTPERFSKFSQFIGNKNGCN